jgi:hypothetical protein
VVLLPASTALTRLAPTSFLAGTTFHFKQKSRLDEAKLKGQLVLAGYQHVSQVVSPGEYAVRGGLIDLFPMGSPVPYRVDLFGDEVDSIRTFDPDSQRSLYPVPEVRLLPGREFPMDEAARAPPSARAGARSSKATRRARACTRTWPRHRRRRHRVLPAAVLRADGDDLRLLRRPGGAGAARRGRRRAGALLDRHPRAPPLPAARPGAADPAARSGVPEAEDFFGLTQRTPRWRCAAPSRWTGLGPLPDVAVDRGATEPLASLERTSTHAASRAARGRERGPAREPARPAARPPHRGAQRGHAGRVHRRRRESRDRRRAAGRGLPLARAEAGTSDPVHHRDRALRQHAAGAAAAQAGAGQQRRRADQGPVGAEGRRPGGAPQPRHRPLPGLVQHRPRAKAPASSCTWSTPTRPRCTCRWRSCT